MTRSEPSINEIWRRLENCVGETFETKTGRPFQFEIAGDVFLPSRTEYTIRKAEFSKALQLVPFKGPGRINNTVRGPSYVWAVLHDKRIRQQDW